MIYFDTSAAVPLFVREPGQRGCGCLVRNLFRPIAVIRLGRDGIRQRTFSQGALRHAWGKGCAGRLARL